MGPCPACGEQHPGEGRFCSECGQELRHDALPAGTLLGSGAYEVVEVLGQGGFGITYLARDRSLSRNVAIKEFFPTGSRRATLRVGPGGSWSEQNFSEARQRFLEEGRTLARFDHPGIVRVFTAFEENQTAYIVMELVSGRSLEALLMEKGPLPQDEAVALIRQAALALEEVHRLDLLHRDIKPSNLLLRTNGQVVLVDFGTARQFAGGLTSKQSVMLTPGYAPLEQYAEKSRRGPYTDVYSLAATLFHLLTGSFPESAPDRATGQPLSDLPALRPDLSQQVVTAINRGLDMEPAKRPQTMPEFLALLQPPAEPQAAPSAPVAAAEPPPLPPTPAKPARGCISAMAVACLILMAPLLALGRLGRHLKANPTPTPTPSSPASEPASPTPPLPPIPPFPVAPADTEEQFKACCENLTDLSRELERYAADHSGKYPSSLSEVESQFVNGLPTCPVNAESYRYQANEQPERFQLNCSGTGHQSVLSKYPNSSAGYPMYVSFVGLVEHARIFGGIGITLETDDDGNVVVKNVVDGLPAANRDIRAGARLLQVDGQDVRAKTPKQAAALLGGEPGTVVRVTIFQDGSPRELVLNRAEMTAPY